MSKSSAGDLLEFDFGGSSKGKKPPSRLADRFGSGREADSKRPAPRARPPLRYGSGGPASARPGARAAGRPSPRAQGKGSGGGGGGGWAVGDAVSARPSGKVAFEKGVIAAVNDNGTFDIDFENPRSNGAGVPAFKIRACAGTESRTSRRADSGSPRRFKGHSLDSEDERSGFEVGDKVEARYKGRARWFPGTIMRKNRDGTFEIRYDDGEEELEVSAELIRKADGVKQKPSSRGAETDEESSDFKLGDQIEARYKGKLKWFKGEIAGVNGDGTYDIRYKDGDQEMDVKKSFIRRVSEEISEFAIGDKVEARYRGRAKWFPGTVMGSNRDGTFEIRYDDGEEELKVKANLIRKMEGGKSSKKKSAMDSDNEGEEEFRMGDEVEARYRGKMKWYKGKIIGVNREGSYDIRYEDGDEEVKVKAELIRSLGGGKKKSSRMEGQESDAEEDFEVGDKVEARYRGRARWFPGTVMRRNRDGTFEIKYDDGEEELQVEASLIRKVGGAKSSKKKSTLDSSDEGAEEFRIGDEVEARYRGKMKWYKGKVIGVNRDGSYDIRYEDGDEEVKVKAELIRSLGGGKKKQSSRKENRESDAEEELEVGDKVEARYRGRARWFPGTVMRRNRDGTFEIKYDDGEEELKVEASLIRKVGGGKSPPKKSAMDSSDEGAEDFRIGDEVEARYRGKMKWYKGKIIGVSRDGSYDIRYEDGDEEVKVKAELVRSLGGSKKERTSRVDGRESDAMEELEVGDKVEARYRGRTRWFPGTVMRRNRDGTFEIKYDDGEEELKVEASLIRRVGGGKSPKKKSAMDSSDEGAEEFRIGDEVEARYRGKMKWYKGKVIGVNRDGSYDIRYEDGDEELKVKAELIRSLGGSKKTKPSRMDGQESGAEEDFEVGDKVEARYRGRARWFPGTVMRRNRDGTFEIKYDDGEEELKVEASLIRKVGGAKSHKKKSAMGSSDEGAAEFRIGGEVEARYRGKMKWYKGKIIGVNRNGSYDIRYEDGDEELKVKAELIRSLGGSKNKKSSRLEGQESDAEEDFEVGDKVEARYRGRARWFPGTVMRRNRDGTFEIKYDDGEEELKVEASLIRKVGGAKSPKKKSAMDSGDEGEEEFKVGDEVEARYRGKMKWYKGKIIGLNRDGSCDIRYEDGDEELKVKAELVRSLGGSKKKKSSKMEGQESDAEEELEVGDKVEARYRGRARWFPGTVMRRNRDGTFEIKYDDGEEELKVEASLIRKMGGGKSPKKKSAMDSGDEGAEEFRIGDEVEARYRGKMKWYKGKIIGVNRDGSYDIRYEDGDEELKVKAELIRSLGGSKKKKSSRMESQESDAEEELEVGDKVEARYRGRARWFPGTVMRRNRDGTFEIKYDDGEEELKVEASLVRKVGGGKSPQKKKSAMDSSDEGAEEFRIGDEVEARYRGKMKWYKGKIIGVNRDGSYAIRYEDGDEELKVKAELIRSLGGSKKKKSSRMEGQESDAEEELGAGDKVEARYRGRARWFPGTVMRRNRDGTFEIKYDDGEEELKVEASLIRKVGGGKSPKKKSAMDSSDEGAEEFRIGDEVEARYRGKMKWYKGKIIGVNRDGSYDIRYEDGDEELKVKAELIRSLGSSKKKQTARKEGRETDAEEGFEVGDKVEARYRGRARWFPGTVMRRNRDGTFEIKYDDGEEELKVEASLIRKVGGGKSPKKKSAMDSSDEGAEEFRIGDEVEARYRGKMKWYKGKIIGVNRDGSYDIRYEDGDEELKVKSELIRSLGDSKKKKSPRKDGRESDAEEDFEVGDKVEARYRGRARWFPGTVMRRNRDGTFEIKYDDGEEELKVEASLIRKVGGAKSPKKKSAMDSSDEGAEEFRIGDEVEARYRGKMKWYKGNIIGVNRDGSYDIRYEDGDEELKVKAELIRSLGDSKKKKSSRMEGRESDAEEDFEVGDKVEARYRGRARWFPGTVMRRNRDGTFEIKYDDGEEELKVEASLIRKVGGSKSPKKKSAMDSSDEGAEEFRIGDEVEARYRGKMKWYKGNIIGVNRDGSYDIRYEDGDEELKVKAELIRSLGGSKKKKTSRMEGGESDAEEDFEVGDKVEARYRGRARWFPGTVMRRNRDGTFEIKYDDGEEELKVEASLIRKVDGDKSSKKKSAVDSSDERAEDFRIGDDVEARYRGKMKWYKGKIIGVNRDGTYDIRYEDGDEEVKVKAELIRSLGGSKKKKSSSKEGRESDAEEDFEVGDKVEARYRGRARWFPGTVMRRNRDGTFEVKYDDGEEEFKVKGNLMRRLEGAKSPQKRSAMDSADEGDFNIGDEVEARYRGKMKWYKGNIIGVNRDGSYDIRYEDNEEEQQVQPRLIRKLEKRKGARSDSEEDDVKYDVGDNVEAQYKGKRKWYTGIVTRCHLNGTYDVKYEDGEKESNVHARNMRLIKRSSKKSKLSDSDGDSDEHPSRGKKFRKESKKGNLKTQMHVDRWCAKCFAFSKRNRKDLKDLFDRFSVYDGVISKKGFLKAIDVLDLEPESSVLDAIVDQFNDGEGRINYLKFAQYCKKCARDESEDESLEEEVALIPAKLRQRLIKYMDSPKKTKLPNALGKLNMGKAKPISKQQFRSLLKKMGLNMNATEAALLTEIIDIDKSGRMFHMHFVHFMHGLAFPENKKSLELFVEICKATEEWEEDSKSSIETVFSKYDRDETGSISCSKLEKAFQKFGVGAFSQGSSKKHGQTKRRTSRIEALESKVQDEVARLASTRGGEPDYFKVFNKMDRDGGGELSKIELIEALDVMGFELSTKDARALADYLDTDGDDRVSYREFEAFAQGGSNNREQARRTTSHVEALEMLEERFPADEEGYIDWKRLSLWIKSGHQQTGLLEKRLGHYLSILENRGHSLKSIFRAADLDAQGHLSVKECKALFGKLGFMFTELEIEILLQKFEKEGAINPKKITKLAQAGSTNGSQKKMFGRFKKKDRTPSSDEGSHNEDDLVLLSADLQRRLLKLCRHNKGETSVKKVFEALDSNGDGTISKKELRKGLKSLGMELSKKEEDQLLQVLDYDGSGKISYMEFLLFIGQPSEKSCQRLKNTQKDVFNQWAVLETKSAYMAFEKYDEDLTGYIPTRMLRKVCRKLGLDLSEDNIEIISTEFESKRGFNYECFIAWCETSNLDRAERKVGHCLALLERAGMSFADVFGLKERGSEINPHQFQQVMLSLGFPLSHSEIDALIAKYDVDENGRIDVGELKRLLAKASAILDQNQSAAHNLGSVWKSATSQLSKAKKKEIAGNSDGTGFDIEEVQRALKKKIVQKARSQKDGSLKAVFNDISKGSLKPFGPRDLQLVMEEFGLDTNRKVKQALLNSMDLSGSGQVALYEFVHFISPVVGDDELRAVVNKLRQRLLKNQGSDDEQHSDDLNSLNASFVKFDKKSNGVVKTLQCENVLEESNAQLKAKEISLIIKFLDPENCGKVYYPEFVLLLRKDPIEFVQRQICQRIQALKRDGLSDKELFSALDTQDRGYITSADLVSGFQRWGLILNPDDCDSFIEKNGGDGEGRMVFKAFKQVEDGLAKGPTKRYIDPDLVSTDIELAILQALEWAFNWFDADGNGRIDADELGTILRAMGKDPSKKQVKGILKAADIDKNNYLSFEEFQSAALPYLLEEMQGSKMTESELKTFFDASDFNGDGQISHEEFTGFFVDTLRILTSDEAATLLRWVDRNKDGNVSWNEFLDLFSLIERLKKDQELEQSMDPVFASALRKLDHGAMPDPKEHILAFMGMPSGFRPSVLAPVGRTTKHTLAKALEVTADSTHGFTVKDMDVKLVSYASQVPTGQASAPVSRQQQAILLPTGAPSEDHTIKQPVFPVQKTRQEDVREVIISLKGARGIPTPHDRRLSDITYRCLRAVLFYDPPKQAGQIRQRSDFFIGNTYSTPAHQDPNKEECWTFTDNDGDHKFLVRTDFVDLKNRNYLEHLYVLLEFTIGLRTQGTHEPGSKGRHRAVSFHSDSLSIDEEKKKSSESESSDSDNDKQEATIKASRKKDRPANSRGKAAENRNSNEKADECQVEMSCGWCKVSMAQIVSMSQTGRIQLDIQGGTPFASESIKPNDIRARRYGWRAAVKKVAGVKKSSQMELKIIPVHKLAAGQKEDIYRMPKNILLPFSSINLVRLYREYAVVKIHDTNLNQSNPIAGLAYGTKFSEPVLALFPKMINDQAMQLALRHHWEEELKDLLPLQKTETNLMIEKFQAIVLRLWPAYSTVEGRKDSRVPESYESMQKRAMILMQAGKGAIPFHERSEIRDTSTADNKKADGKNDDIQGIVKGKQESSIGKVESNSSEEDEGLEEAYIPFHSAEVAFGVSSV